MYYKYFRFLTRPAFILLLILAGCGSIPATQRSTTTMTTPSAVNSSPTVKPSITSTAVGADIHSIFYIMMENHSSSQIIGNITDAPYINQLANTYGIATRYYGVTHPSLPNYLAAISGNFQGIWDDCPAGRNVICSPESFGPGLTQPEYASAASRPHLFSGLTIVDQLEAHHLTWKAYMQSMPSVGYTGDSYGNYAQKHDPFMYFASIRNNPARMQQIVPFTQFQSDMQAGKIANFVWITPDLCNDMHGALVCGSYDGLIAQGDNFIHTVVQQVMSSAVWRNGAAIIITWDENEGSNSGCCNGPAGVGGGSLGGGNVPLIVITSNNPHHRVLSNGSYNHYSLLATIENLWNLGCIAYTCDIGAHALLTPLFAQQ